MQVNIFTGPNDPSLPDNVKELSATRRRQWVAVWNSAFRRCQAGETRVRPPNRSDCEGFAFQNANGVVFAQMKTFEAEVAPVRMEQHNGSPHLVMPVVAVKEGVMNGTMVPGSEISRYVEAWNGIPFTVGHPSKNGEHVSANTPEFDSSVTIGRFWNAEFVNGALRGEVWIDTRRVARDGGDGQTMVEMLLSGEHLDVSTAYFSDIEFEAGQRDGKDFEGIIRNIRPDHLAGLLHEEGACSWTDGCGIPRANRKEDSPKVNIRGTARRPSFVGTEEISWASVDKSIGAFVRAFFRSQGESVPSDFPGNVADFPSNVKSFIASKSLLGESDADTARDLLFFPVVNPSTNKINRGAITAVLGGRGAAADIPASARESAQSMARALLESEYSGHLDEEDMEANVDDDDDDKDVKNYNLIVKASEGPAVLSTLRKLARKVLGKDVPVTKAEAIEKLVAHEGFPLNAEALEVIEFDDLESMLEWMESEEDEGEEAKKKALEAKAKADAKAKAKANEADGDGNDDGDGDGDDEPSEMEVTMTKVLAPVTKRLDAIEGELKTVGANQRAADDEDRSIYIEAITANKLQSFTEDDLKEMDLSVLAKLANSLSPVDYTGRPFPKIITEESGVPDVPKIEFTKAEMGWKDNGRGG